MPTLIPNSSREPVVKLRRSTSHGRVGFSLPKASPLQNWSEQIRLKEWFVSKYLDQQFQTLQPLNTFKNLFKFSKSHKTVSSTKNTNSSSPKKQSVDTSTQPSNKDTAQRKTNPTQVLKKDTNPDINTKATTKQLMLSKPGKTTDFDNNLKYSIDKISPLEPLKTSSIQTLNLKNTETSELVQALAYMMQKYQRSTRLFNIILILTIVIFNSVLAILIVNQPAGGIAQANQQTTESLIKTPNNSEPGVKVINTFASNSGIVDVGFNVKIEKNAIRTDGHPNCSTPIVPPIENGCAFSLIQTGLGIPSRGVKFKSIYFETNLQEGDRIQLDLKNFEKGDLDKKIGVIDKSNFKQKFILPEVINPVYGVYVRLWPKTGNKINITKVVLEYYSVDSFIPVLGKIDPSLLEGSKSLTVYRDVNENSLFDSKIDRKWDCSPTFPGAKIVDVNEEGNFNILRDDECYIDFKPDKWYTDNFKNSLPPGKWLLMNEVNQKTHSFEVKNQQENVKLEFTPEN